MTIRYIFTALLLGLFLISCDSLKKVDDTSSSDNHTSQNSLDWQGTYSGVMPCASCPGIATELTLTSEQNYILTREYIDSEVVDTIKGKFVWKANGSQIELKDVDDSAAPVIYKIEERKIRQMDLEGNVIKGDLAQNYILTMNGNLEVEDKRWKLIELFGKSVKGSSETHYIIFHSKDGRVEAKADCNVILNNYKIKNQYQLNITPGITTMMACPGDLEKEFIEAMTKADNLSVSDSTLSLNKARMAPLARFELSK